MTDFEYDCLQKKRLAGQAKYRKRGSKSKKCSLPSDRLTNKQWKDKCGPVITYSLNKPMTWDDFKKMPVDIQAQYITNLQQNYGVTAVDLGDMFGVRALTVRKHAESNNLGVEFPRGHAMNASRKEAWASFIKEEHNDEEVTAAPVSNMENQEVTVFSPDNADHIDTVPAELAPIQPKAMNMKRFTLQFSGAIDVNMIANSMKLILGDKAEGELEIICNLA